jgi:hypothetical protein
MDTDAVNRIEIRTELGGSTFWADNWTAEIQDDGKTLRLTGRGSGDRT